MVPRVWGRGNIGRWWAIVLACGALFGIAGHAGDARAARTELLSLIGIPLAEGEYLSAFAVQTWTVQVLAVCRMPPGWSLTAGNVGDPGGELSGSANIGAAFLDRTRLGLLGGLFLVRVGEYRAQPTGDPAQAYMPASFSGTATIGRYGQDGERKLTLTGRNLRRQAAERCPAPAR